MLFLIKKYFLLFSTAVVIAGLYCYNPFVLYFQNDDFIHIPLSAEGKLFQHNSFRPVCDLSVMLDYFLWHKNAWGYHLTNLLLHIFDTILVFIFCKILFKKYALLNNVFEASLLTALLFFIYPNHSEAVFWILGRSASLGVLFFLFSLIFYLKREEKKYFLLSIIFAIIAWLTYESTWILPLVFLMFSIIDVKLKFSYSKKEFIKILLLVFCFFLYIAARFFFIHQVAGEYEAAGFLHFDLQNLSIHFFKLMMRSWLPSSYNPVILIAVFICILSALLFLFFKIKNKYQRVFFQLLIIVWLISLLLCASLGMDTKGTEAERFLYLPSIFICILIVFLLNKIVNEKARQLMVSAIFITSIFFLYCNALSYRFAGNITKTTINEINKLSGKKNLYIHCLPKQNHGALIFRAGFFEAIKWMKNAGTVDSVFIVSQQINEQPFCNDYKIQVIDSLPEMNFTVLMIQNIDNSNDYKMINVAVKRLDKNDAYFDFTAASLNIHR
jgi:hypothetical protein